MTKQTINVGSAEKSGDGESIRSSFVKINENFDEVYNNIDGISTQVTDTTTEIEQLADRVNTLDISDLTDNGGLLNSGGGSEDVSWTDPQTRTFNTVSWSSGRQITITATPYETATFTTYDDRTNSSEIFFVWDQDFIDNVWNGYNTDAGEGEGYQVSLDNGVTWYDVERNGYSTGNYFYFAIPWEERDTYSFTYTQGQSVLMRFNRGSLSTVWFDLADAPVSPSTIIGVDMSVIVEATIPGDPDRTATVIRPNYRFMNVLFDNDTYAGEVNSGARIWSGSEFVEDRIELSIRKTTEPEDAGRIYARFDNGAVGTMTIYWNAKLYTIT